MNPKKLIALILPVVFACSLSAQDNMVQYKVTRDDPYDICNFWMHLDLGQMDIGFKNINGLSINAGLYGAGLMKGKFGFDYTARYGWLTLGKLANSNFKSALQFEVSGLYKIGDHAHTKQMKVILDQKKSTSGNIETTTTTYIKPTGTERKMIYLHAGPYVKRNPYRFDDPDLYGTDIDANATSVGFHAGISSFKVHNLYGISDKYGKACNAAIWRLYADVLVLPVVSLEMSGTSYTKTIKPGHFGFRCGVTTYSSDVKKYNKHGKVAFQAEAGYRPVDGLFVAGTMSITIQRKKLAAFGAAPEGSNTPIEKE